MPAQKKIVEGLKTFHFAVQFSKGFRCGLGLGLVIHSWNIPGLHNLKDEGSKLIIHTFHEPEYVADIVSRKTRRGVTLLLLKTEE